MSRRWHEELYICWVVSSTHSSINAENFGVHVCENMRCMCEGVYVCVLARGVWIYILSFSLSINCLYSLGGHSECQEAWHVHQYTKMVVSFVWIATRFLGLPVKVCLSLRGWVSKLQHRIIKKFLPVGVGFNPNGFQACCLSTWPSTPAIWKSNRP